MMHKLSACWYDTASTLIAFCRSSPRPAEAKLFKNTLIRLVSVMSALILHDLESPEDQFDKSSFDTDSHIFEVLGWDDLSDAAQDSVMTAGCKVEQVFQSIQQLMVDAMDQGIVAVPPPILTRSFQELGSGLVIYHEAKKLSHVPPPFAYRFVTWLTMIAAATFIPFMLATYAAGLGSSFGFAGSGTFLIFLLNGVAQSMDNPFQKDSYTLNTAAVQIHLNQQLNELLKSAQSAAPSLRSDWCSPGRPSVTVVAQASTMDEVKKVYSEKWLSPKAEKVKPRPFFGRLASVDSIPSITEFETTSNSRGSTYSLPARDSYSSLTPTMQSMESPRSSRVEEAGHGEELRIPGAGGGAQGSGGRGDSGGGEIIGAGSFETHTRADGVLRGPKENKVGECGTNGHADSPQPRSLPSGLSTGAHDSGEGGSEPPSSSCIHAGQASSQRAPRPEPLGVIEQTVV